MLSTTATEQEATDHITETAHLDSQNSEQKVKGTQGDGESTSGGSLFINYFESF